MDTEKYTLLLDRDAARQTVRDIAHHILTGHPDRSPLFIALMRGANPFASMLMFELVRLKPDYHPDIDYMMVSTYGTDRTAKQPVIVTDLAPTTHVEGRDVVIIDDVIDLGMTSDFVSSLMKTRGAASVKLAVLASKDVPSRPTQADFIGFAAGDKWLVGMGLDDAESGHEHFRWLDEIWEIKR